MKKLNTIIFGLLLSATLFSVAEAAAPLFTVPQGGTASSTLTGILIGNGASAVKTLTIGTNLSLTGTTLNASGGGGTFPFTASANYNSTSTAIGFLQGLFSTASSTFNSAVRFPALSDGGLGVNGGLLYSGATTTAGTGLTYSAGAFNVSGLTTTQFASANISQWTNNSGYLTSLAGAASSTLLSDFNTFSHIITGSISGNAGTATALAADGANCSAGSYPLGVDASGAVQNCTAVSAGSAFPFTPTSYGNSTSSVILFTQGLISNSSTTISGLVSGLVGNNDGKLYGFASSSLFGYTPLNPTRALTVAGTANQITSSAGSQDLSADRTWTLSLPTHVIFPAGGFETAIATTTNATTTSSQYFTFITDKVLSTDVNGKLFGTATGTVSAGSSAITVTAGRQVFGGALSIDCATAGASQNGCLSSANFTTFNNKIDWGTATATSPNQSVYTDNFGKLVSAATSSETCTSPLSCTSHDVLKGGGAITIANAVSDGSTKGAASFTANDFNDATGNISIDYTNGQAAANTTKGFLAGADFTTFNVNRLSTTSVLTNGQLLVSGAGAAGNTTYSIATGTITGSTGLSVTAGQSIIGSGLTITNTGVTSNVAGNGISLNNTTGAVTITNSYGYPFISGTTYNVANQGTTTPIWFQGNGTWGLFASSTSVFDNASTTALSADSYFRVPFASSFSNFTKGSLAFDTTSGNLILGTTTSTTAAVVVGGATSTLAWFAIASTSPNLVSGGHIDIEANPLPTAVTGVICHVDGGTSVVVNISNVAGSSDSNAVTCTSTSGQYAFTSNNSFSAYAASRVELGTVTGAVNYLHLRFIGYSTPD